MTVTVDPFAPLLSTEMEENAKPKKAEKTPILPVPDDAPEMTFKNPEWGKPVRIWEYRNEKGELLAYDGRFEKRLPDGTIDKQVLPIAYCDLGEGKRAWRQKAMPKPRSLYGLDRLAARPNAPVVIAEGAKSADAAGDLLPDHVSVSWQGGANAIGMSYWRSLENRHVLIWPDRDRQCDERGFEKPYEDQPGTIAAENIVARIGDIAASVQVLDLEAWDCEGGWDAADALAEGWSPAVAAEFVTNHAKLIDLNAPGTYMPPWFETDENGVYSIGDDGLRKRLCGRIKLLAKTRDINGGGWGLLLEWRDEDGRQHRWPMPKSLLAGDGSAIREYLLSHGLYVTTTANLRSKLLEFFATVSIPTRARAVNKVGWAGKAFALPEMTIGDTPEDRVIFQQEDGAVHRYGTAGTLAEWQEHVGKLAIGNSRLIFAMAAALVGPILGPTNEEGGGINYVGASSTGKTTALRGAASVWGPFAFIRAWRATGNALEGVAQQHNETLLCLDELSQVDPKEAGAIAYMLGNGQGKSRATRTGGARSVSTWNLLFLSTGEVGLADVVKEGRQARRPMAGQEVRILDVPADAGAGMGVFENLHGLASGAAFSRHFATMSKTYYGTPAIEFLQQLTGIQDQIGELIAGTAEQFANRYVAADADGQVQRAGRRFGLVAAAGELAIALGVMPWPKNAALNAAATMFSAWVQRRGGTGSAENRNILDQIRLFLEQHGNSRFEPWVVESASGDDDDSRINRPVHNRAGYWRHEYADDDVENRAQRRYFIFPTVFRQEVCAGLDIDQVTKLLAQVGALKLDSQGKSTRSERLPGEAKPQRMFVIGPEVFDVE